MSESAVPQLKIELLYRKSRLAGRHIWAGEYPENEVLDDIENYRPLELLHLNNLLRSRIWQLGVSRSEGQQTEDSPEMLMEDFTKIAEVSTMANPLSFYHGPCGWGKVDNFSPSS